MTQRGSNPKTAAPPSRDAGSAPPARNARGDRRREALLTAGLELLAESGWEGITHRKVAARADSHAALVQYYFDNLAGLRAAIAAHASARLIAPAASTVSEARDLDAVGTLLARSASAAAADRATAALLTQIVVGMRLYPEVDAVVRADLDRARAELAQMLVSLDPRWRPDEAEHAAALAIAVMDGVVMHGASALWGAADPGRTARLSAALRAILRP